MKKLSWMLLVSVLLFVPARAPATPGDEELRNDAFESGDSVAFQGAFDIGEIAASRLTAAIPCPCQVMHVDLLFGGANAVETVTLRVWDDDGSSDTPGTPRFNADYQLTGSNTAMQQLDLSAEGLIVSQSFRVGVEFQHAGYPSVAADTDGTITDERNFILANSVGWKRSSFFGLDGDWILRATVRSVPLFADGFESGTTVAWSSDVP